jgi:hypothetical protein
MVWLLIIFCLAVAVSPLMWMKSSPRQQQVMVNRKKARSLTINFNICKQADASDSENRLDAIFYWLDWQQDNLNESWVLHRRSNRGWESCFDGWRWINQEADKAWLEVIGSIIDDLPSGVSAIVTNKQGIGVVWDERGDGVAVDNLHQCLIKLRDKGKEICI